MSEHRSKRTEAENVNHVADLLGLLGRLSQRDPSPALRERLSVLARQRFNKEQQTSLHGQGVGLKPLAWLKPAFAMPLLVAIGLATVFVVHDWRRDTAPASNRAPKANLSAMPSDGGTHTLPAVRSSETSRPKIHHRRPVLTSPVSPQLMTMRLPYSNSAIDTGTSATIQVSMSRSDLLSLGFPVSATVQGERIVAELTLGDDGLPRAISLPLPLEVMKEKK